MEEKRSSLMPILAALLLASPLLYVPGYYLLSSVHDRVGGPELRCRTYQSQWMASAFRHFAKAEELMTGKEVVVATHLQYEQLRSVTSGSMGVQVDNRNLWPP